MQKTNWDVMILRVRALRLDHTVSTGQERTNGGYKKSNGEAYVVPSP